MAAGEQLRNISLSRDHISVYSKAVDFRKPSVCHNIVNNIKVPFPV
jgi:hypothetical protein